MRWPLLIVQNQHGRRKHWFGQGIFRRKITRTAKSSAQQQSRYREYL
jgi:hypothetical protein